MQYYMTSTDDNYWHPCEATTLRVAKCEAIRAYGAGFRGSTITLATGNGVEEERVIMSCRTIGSPAWVDARD